MLITFNVVQAKGNPAALAMLQSTDTLRIKAYCENFYPSSGPIQSLSNIDMQHFLNDALNETFPGLKRVELNRTVQWQRQSGIARWEQSSADAILEGDSEGSKMVSS